MYPFKGAGMVDNNNNNNNNNNNTKNLYNAPILMYSVALYNLRFLLMFAREIKFQNLKTNI